MADEKEQTQATEEADETASPDSEVAESTDSEEKGDEAKTVPASAPTFDELKKMTVAQLRAVAKKLDHDAVKGYSQLNKEHLLPAVCQALGIDAHEHHHAERGFDKAAVKATMRALKVERQAAIEAHDHAKLKAVRRQLHRLNHRVRTHVH